MYVSVVVSIIDAVERRPLGFSVMCAGNEELSPREDASSSPVLCFSAIRAYHHVLFENRLSDRSHSEGNPAGNIGTNKPHGRCGRRKAPCLEGGEEAALTVTATATNQEHRRRPRRELKRRRSWTNCLPLGRSRRRSFGERAPYLLSSCTQLSYSLLRYRCAFVWIGRPCSLFEPPECLPRGNRRKKRNQSPVSPLPPQE